MEHTTSCPLPTIEHHHTCCRISSRVSQDEAARAYLAFHYSARRALVAHHQGQYRRARGLTLLAAKQHRRWLAANGADTGVHDRWDCQNSRTAATGSSTTSSSGR